jgi:hypothetical protein
VCAQLDGCCEEYLLNDGEYEYVGTCTLVHQGFTSKPPFWHFFAFYMCFLHFLNAFFFIFLHLLCDFFCIFGMFKNEFVVCAFVCIFCVFFVHHLHFFVYAFFFLHFLCVAYSRKTA